MDEPSQPDETREDLKGQFKVYTWIWRELFNHICRRYAKRFAVAQIFADLLTLMVPWIFGKLVNHTVSRDAQGALFSIGELCLVLLVRQWVNLKAAQSREIALGEIIGAVDHQSNALFFEKSLGQLLRDHDALSAANIEKGRSRVTEISNLMLFEGVETIFLLLLTFVSLWSITPLAGIAAGLLFGIHMGWSMFLTKQVNEVCTPLDKAFRALNRYRMERWERVERVKTFGKETEETCVMAKNFENIIDTDRRFWLWYIKHDVIRGSIARIIFLGILGFGVWQILHGNATVGMLFPLYSWTNWFIENLGRLSHIEHRLNWAFPAVRSMMGALTTPPDIVDVPDAQGVDPTHGIHVEMCDVSHTYRPSPKEPLAQLGPRPVLQHVSFSIEPGERVALLGKSGAGKSTIMRFLQRGMDPDQGSIRINGIDLRELKLSSWLDCVGYIPQQSIVFDGTLRSNLLYGLDPSIRADVDDDETWKLVRLLQIDFAGRLTNGLDTLVGRNGVKLSGGEAQRLMIGSAVAKKPLFMLIDEATSSLDSSTERAVQAGLNQALANGISALIITHRLSTVEHNCDKYVILRRADEVQTGESQIEAIGTSLRELYLVSPTLRQLVDDQGIRIN